jgi:hypothetical protein
VLRAYRLGCGGLLIATILAGLVLLLASVAVTRWPERVTTGTWPGPPPTTTTIYREPPE